MRVADFISEHRSAGAATPRTYAREFVRRQRVATSLSIVASRCQKRRLAEAPPPTVTAGLSTARGGVR